MQTGDNDRVRTSFPSSGAASDLRGSLLRRALVLEQPHHFQARRPPTRSIGLVQEEDNPGVPAGLAQLRKLHVDSVGEHSPRYHAAKRYAKHRGEQLRTMDMLFVQHSSECVQTHHVYDRGGHGRYLGFMRSKSFERQTPTTIGLNKKIVCQSFGPQLVDRQGGNADNLSAIAHRLSD
jgi:hypothetical protein